MIVESSTDQSLSAPTKICDDLFSAYYPVHFAGALFGEAFDPRQGGGAPCGRLQGAAVMSVLARMTRLREHAHHVSTAGGS
jgi:hypothetical protein